VIQALLPFLSHSSTSFDPCKLFKLFFFSIPSFFLSLFLLVPTTFLDSWVQHSQFSLQTQHLALSSFLFSHGLFPIKATKRSLPRSHLRLACVTQQQSTFDHFRSRPAPPVFKMQSNQQQRLGSRWTRVIAVFLVLQAVTVLVLGAVDIVTMPPGPHSELR